MLYLFALRLGVVFCLFNYSFKNVLFPPLSSHHDGSSFEVNWWRVPIRHDWRSVIVHIFLPYFWVFLHLQFLIVISVWFTLRCNGLSFSLPLCLSLSVFHTFFGSLSLTTLTVPAEVETVFCSSTDQVEQAHFPSCPPRGCSKSRSSVKLTHKKSTTVYCRPLSAPLGGQKAASVASSFALGFRWFCSFIH